MAYVAKITIDNTKVASDLTDFPVYVDLADLPADFWSTISSATIQDKIVAWWQLENVNDSIGSYTLTNNNTVTFTAGKLDNAGTFNGTNQSLNNNSVWGATSYPRSYGGWVKFDTVASGGDQAIISIGDGTTHYYSLKLRDSDNKIVFRSNNSTDAGDVDTGTTASASTWYHLVVVQHSATSVSLYVNGTKTNTTATTFSATVSQFYLGYLGRSSVWFLDGQIDDVFFANGALTDNDVTLLYNSGTGNRAGLVKSGGDVRVYKADGTTELAREIVSCNTDTDTGEMHFKYSGTLSGSTDTEVQIHADGVSADYAVTATYGRNAVWSDYRVVMHTGVTTDSSGNITPSATVFASTTTAKIGAVAYSSTGGTTSEIATGSISGRTISLWARNTGGNAAGYVVDARTGLSNGYLYRDNPAGTLQFGGGFSSVYLNASTATAGSTTLSGSTWGHLVLKTSAGWTDDVFFGNRYTGRVTNDSWVGQFDEIRITKTADLSADWITTEYNNQNSPSTFYTATTASTDYPLTASLGTFTLTGISANLTSARKLIAALGAFTLTGFAAAIGKGFMMLGALGTFTLTGQDALFSGARKMVVDTGTFVLTGVAATFQYMRMLFASLGTFILTLQDVVITRKSWNTTDKNNDVDWTEATKNTSVDWTDKVKD